MTRSDYRPRTGTELIDAAFQLIKSQFSTVITISAIGCIPMLLVYLFSPFSPTNLAVQRWNSILLNMVASFVAIMFLEGSLLFALSEAYLGRQITVSASVSSGLRNMGRLFIAYMATGFLIGLAFVLLIVPGFIVFTWLFVVPALVVIERAPLTSATLSRSRALCGDTKLRILGFGLIFSIAGMIVAGTSAIALHLTKSLVFSELVGILQCLICWPLYMAFVIVQYYDARIRKEGYDVELMASTLSPSDAPQPATI